MASPLRSWVWEASFYQLKYDRCVPSGIAMGVKKKRRNAVTAFSGKEVSIPGPGTSLSV